MVREQDRNNFKALKAAKKQIRLLSHPNLFVWNALMEQTESEEKK